MKTPQERYRDDVNFHMLVDVLTDFIVRCEFSPSELREAAVLAAIHYESIYASPQLIVEGDRITRVDGYHSKNLREEK